MKLRKIHRLVAITLSPFLLLLAITGCLLFFRKLGIYEKEIKEILVGVHTWEIVMPYIGLILGAGFLFIVVSGIILFFNPRA
ncbi:hypothetical protein [Alteromonas sp. a30]|uniref:hypothetical protein n=1 Tax=Alteromonas sp. a30 TaxID=2730917 RepID=UPI0022811F70|nr:hypothetical protein [Alteromonas sp. a30]MCY7297096.1 hypothetical protein [Alteromonas sp. a30]